MTAVLRRRRSRVCGKATAGGYLATGVGDRGLSGSRRSSVTRRAAPPRPESVISTLCSSSTSWATTCSCAFGLAGDPVGGDDVRAFLHDLREAPVRRLVVLAEAREHEHLE